MQIDYTNYKNEREIRTVLPIKIEFGSNEWHPDPQWLMLAYDFERRALRTFSLRGIHSWSEYND